MIVIDASVLVPALAEDGARGHAARERLRGESLVAPELIDLEVASVLRGLVLGTKLSALRASPALDDLLGSPFERAPHLPLLPRCWELRDNLTAYDASYVALAELLEVTLVTADARLANVSGITCRVEVLSA